MNVLNKIKSKKAKEPLRVTDDPQPPSKPSPPKQQDSQASSLRPSSNLFIEKREIVPARWKAEVEADEDDATVSDYFSKKDKEKKSLMSRSEGSDQFREQDYKDFTCINVKKAYTIGSICLFEGEVVVKKAGREERRRMSISCGSQAVSFPESIAKIIVSRVTFISDQEAVFVGEDIIKIMQRGQVKK